MRYWTRAMTVILAGVVAGAAAASAAGMATAAQTTLASLGLTETAARTFVLNEIKEPSDGRGSPIAQAGKRAFFKLPRAARAAAATALFAWAKAYVGSPAFAASYTSYRKGRIPSARQYALTVEQAVKKQVDDQLAGLAQMESSIASMPPAERAPIQEQIAKARASYADPATIKQMQAQLAAERARESAQTAELMAEVEETMPADPRKLFARRLREFLNATADVNFSARTITLVLEPNGDGVEFMDKADRARHWMWQEAAIVGPEATAAARAAASAWLKEIER
jgi:hypothetical protein